MIAPAAAVKRQRNRDTEFGDASHVALATTGEADLIISWNFRHIVHFEKLPRYNAVNRLNGWRELAIHTPREVIAYEDEDV